jgi:hypothetical protein
MQHPTAASENRLMAADHASPGGCIRLMDT